jgi:hypothetical protein
MFMIARLAVRVGQFYLGFNFGMFAVLILAKAGLVMGLVPAAAVFYIGWKLVQALDRVAVALKEVGSRD